MRKDFTPSERIAILAAIEKKSVGRPLANSVNLPNKISAAAMAGFGSERTARSAGVAVENGTAELVAAMDAGLISIAARPSCSLRRERDAEEFHAERANCDP